jgi:hypothetical protein
MNFDRKICKYLNSWLPRELIQMCLNYADNSLFRLDILNDLIQLHHDIDAFDDTNGFGVNNLDGWWSHCSFTFQSPEMIQLFSLPSTSIFEDCIIDLMKTVPISFNNNLRISQIAYPGISQKLKIKSKYQVFITAMDVFRGIYELDKHWKNTTDEDPYYAFQICKFSVKNNGCDLSLKIKVQYT